MNQELPQCEVDSRFIRIPEQGWQQRWNRLSEWANPIVVKEARQALNSRQFAISFSLTLIAVLFWTVMAVILQMPGLYYVPGGMYLLSGFMVILAFPLLLIIPYSAFRSMIIESEERTFELVSISALSAKQIVDGKMYSALLQIIIYLSTLTPCFVITYLLRGVLLSSILYYLIFTLLLSITLTAVAILVATVGRAKLVQVVASICVLAGLILAAFIWSITSVNTLAFWDLGQQGWLLVLGLFALTGTFLPVCLRCATAAIDFPSENHATALRVRLLIFVVNALGWGLWIGIESEAEQACYTFILIGLAVFLLFGAFVSAEMGLLSPRAQRTLPRTWVGRMLGTWFYPGAGLGYIFLTCLLTAYMTAWIAMVVLAPSFRIGISDVEQIATFAVVCWLYFVFYSGISRLLMMLIPRTVNGRMIIGLLVQSILLLAGIAFPYLIGFTAYGFREPDYDWLQFPNPIWLLSELDASGIGLVAPSIILLALCALPIFGLNLFLCGRDVLLVRVQQPERVQAELRQHALEPVAPPDPFA